MHFKKGFQKGLSYIYVLSHELTHLIFGVFSGNKVKKIMVKPSKGYVSFKENPNPITAISPYIFPLYNVIIFLLYIIISHFIKKDFFTIFLTLQGFFLSFHIINTIDVISLNQSDFKKTGGRVISILIIILSNIVITALIINFLISNDKKMIYQFIKSCMVYYILIIKKVYLLIVYLYEKLKMVL